MGEHEHVVNEFSSVKWNGGDPVFLCGHDGGECRVIVCYADIETVSINVRKYVPGRPFDGTT